MTWDAESLLILSTLIYVIDILVLVRLQEREGRVDPGYAA
jgi:hypothetical protein